MPALNNAFVTESDVINITKQYYVAITNNQLCTRLRAIQLGADSSYLTEYDDNQLVRYQHIKAIYATNFTVTYRGSSHYYVDGEILAGNDGDYVFSDITAPDYGDFTSDADYWWELALSNPITAANQGGTTTQEVDKTINSECCILFRKSDFYHSGYGTNWHMQVYSVDAGGNKIAGTDFQELECEGYIVFIFQGKLGTIWNTELVVEFSGI